MVLSKYLPPLIFAQEELVREILKHTLVIVVACSEINSEKAKQLLNWQFISNCKIFPRLSFRLRIVNVGTGNSAAPPPHFIA